MRKAFLTATAALVVVAGLIPATAASAGNPPRVRHYEGPTSEGGRVSMSVVVKAGVARLSLLLVQAPLRCEDGTEGEMDDGVGWVQKGPALTDAQLELSENWLSVAFAVSGHLGSHRGSGTLTFLYPAFTADERSAQVCSTGELTWSVERTTGEDFSSRSAVTVEGEGRGTHLMGLEERGSDDATLARGTGPVRRYRGRTSQVPPGEENGHFTMSAQTQRPDSGIALRALTFGNVLACEDGTEIWGSIRPTAYFDATQVMSPGRLDLDLAPSSGYELIVNLHGELDAHAGSGSLTMTEPHLTDDLDAQLCTTGDQTWELWRTDAGY
jgi:hypothetical protein